ncbi:MAG: N-acetylmuramoyl-L-alanine amidase [Sinobacterium sp.]|nr:N-acetylmuramoyl-L-alanine amidase [Sinobacterium sp.]
MSFLRKQSRYWLVMCLLSLSVQLHAKTDVHEVRLWRSPDNTRVVFDMTGAATHKVFTLKSPHRVVLDIKNVTMSADLSQLSLKDTPVSSIRFAIQGDTGVRVVLDTSQAVNVRSFFLKKNGDAKDRLVLDLASGTSSKKAVKSKKNVQEIKRGKRDIIIAIDAGHGGEDPGAIGPKKIYEKKVVLGIAKELKSKFNAQKGYKAVLVRKGDYYIPLSKRRDIARMANADMFVSIHADAFSSPKAHGTSVYALSSKGATSAFARFLANKENKSDLVGGVSLNDKDAVLSSVLLDLSMTHKMQSSLEIGEHVLGYMGKISRLHSKRVEQAAFAVLKTPDIPSLLIETGFISNPGEAKKLSTSSYRKKMANAIYQGVNEWFRANASEDTYIAQRSNKGRRDSVHIVSRGDTLSGIAGIYGVSMAQVKKSNKLRSSSLKIGQRLIIPPK